MLTQGGGGEEVKILKICLRIIGMVPYDSIKTVANDILLRLLGIVYFTLGNYYSRYSTTNHLALIIFE